MLLSGIFILSYAGKLFGVLDKTARKMYNNSYDWGEQSRWTEMSVRKVRASQSRITDNVRRRRLPG